MWVITKLLFSYLNNYNATTTFERYLKIIFNKVCRPATKTRPKLHIFKNPQKFFFLNVIFCDVGIPK